MDRSHALGHVFEDAADVDLGVAGRKLVEAAEVALAEAFAASLNRRLRGPPQPFGDFARVNFGVWAACVDWSIGLGAGG